MNAEVHNWTPVRSNVSNFSLIHFPFGFAKLLKQICENEKNCIILEFLTMKNTIFYMTGNLPVESYTQGGYNNIDLFSASSSVLMWRCRVCFQSVDCNAGIVMVV